MQKQFAGLLALLCLSSACQSGGRGDPVPIPDGRVSLDEGGENGSADAQRGTEDTTPFDPRTFDPRIPIHIDQPLSEVASLWQAGATLLMVKENRLGVCEQAEEASCSDEEEWRLERNSRRFSHSTCRCGKSESRDKVLSAAEFKAIEEKIIGLGTASHPAPCTADAPEVSLELTSAQGEVSSYKVNYGQCAGTMALRVDLDSFEKLAQHLAKISF